ncbi:hypothetical protein GALMADRAFT_248404 [Galerina marginata CBS 339.88]|uniref:Asteroid domain-containing protein n=1 Tax=Galerina marginata (strain CBS 339.88) TaxID=685588 RepID=A0A067SXW3_GALM3|nr:hypothetical protein GALMADRAFT_248404 [Galerina marginata CBS 339.88]
MGVHGLTTYLREKKRLLSTTTVVSPSSKTSVPIVVDGWSFIYNLYQTSGLPWVYGGEYVEFGRLVKVVVESWIQVGFQVYFVFDGACPDLKFPTVVSRLSQSHILPAQLFFRTSVVSRCTGRFLNENRILPPLAYSTTIHALESLRGRTEGLEIHYADEEGDPYAVELAGRIGGYVVGNDSDFVILNSDGYCGYIPIDEMVWQTPLPDFPTPINEEDGDFQTVRKPKAKKRIPQHIQNVVGLLPPENREDLALSFVSYSPEALASHLNIPITLLPLFGALVGNDFSRESESDSRKIQALFFERHLTLSQRIDKVANTMHSVVSPGNQQRKAKHQVGSVMDLIDRTVNALLTRLIGTLGSGEIESIIDRIVNATLQYAIPKYGGNLAGREGLWPTSVCALHEPETCYILPMISHNVMRQSEISDQADPNLLDAREKYLDAYRNGLLSPKIMDLLNTSSSWARLFLENPDLETVGRSIGRPIREWVYATLQDTVGLPIAEVETPTSTRENDSVEDESDDDELIDVVESDSDDQDDLPRPDFLAPLKGALHRLHSEEPANSEDSATDPPLSIISHRRLPTGPPTVTEYLRRGTRMASETIIIKPLSELLPSIALSEYADDSAPPLVLRSDEERFTVLLRVLKSDVASVRNMPPEIISAVLAVRWVVYTLDIRWQETGSKEREKERWTKNEARCLLSSFASTSNDISQGTRLNSEPPPIEDRNVQLMAQILMALDMIEQLSQSLLLLERVPGTAHQLSGRAFHALLTGRASIETMSLPVGIWEAAEIGLLNAYQEERAKKGKKSKAAKSPAASSLANGSRTNIKSGGLFAMLGDIEA